MIGKKVFLFGLCCQKKNMSLISRRTMIMMREPEHMEEINGKLAFHMPSSVERPSDMEKALLTTWPQ